ncbi:MAG: hypothetical protein ACOC8F_01185 [Planctomycetota bacterium]
MSESPAADEQRLIDYVLGRCDADDADRVRRRLDEDEAFARRRTALEHTFAALNLAPQAEPPDDLVERTLERVARQKQTDAILARHERRSGHLRPTFSMREFGGLAAAAVLIAAVMIPSLIEAGRVGLARRCTSRVGELGEAIQASAIAHDGSLPAAAVDPDAPGDDGVRWLPSGDGRVVSNSAALFQLIRDGYVSASQFQCPAVGGESFVVRAGMSDFPAGKYVSYSYQHAIGNCMRQNDPELAEVAEEMAILADATPLFEQGRFRPARLDASASDNHRGRGQSVLYLDMHAEWTETPHAGVGRDPGDRDHIFLAGQIRNYHGRERPISPHDTFLLPTYTPRR